MCTMKHAVLITKEKKVVPKVVFKGNFGTVEFNCKRGKKNEHICIITFQQEKS